MNFAVNSIDHAAVWVCACMRKLRSNESCFFHLISISIDVSVQVITVVVMVAMVTSMAMEAVVKVVGTKAVVMKPLEVCSKLLPSFINCFCQ